MADDFLSTPIFEWRRVTSLFMENAKMAVFPFKHQMHSWQQFSMTTGKVCRIICCILPITFLFSSSLLVIGNVYTLSLR